MLCSSSENYFLHTTSAGLKDRTHNQINGINLHLNLIIIFESELYDHNKPNSLNFKFPSPVRSPAYRIKWNSVIFDIQNIGKFWDLFTSSAIHKWIFYFSKSIPISQHIAMPMDGFVKKLVASVLSQKNVWSQLTSPFVCFQFFFDLRAQKKNYAKKFVSKTKKWTYRNDSQLRR